MHPPDYYEQLDIERAIANSLKDKNQSNAGSYSNAGPSNSNNQSNGGSSSPSSTPPTDYYG